MTGRAFAPPAPRDDVPPAAWSARIALLTACLAVLALACRRFWFSDIYALAASVQDDSFYYILPAFNLKSVGFFSFDGTNPTYGFEPLYEVALSTLAVPFADLHNYFRCVLSFNAALHCLTAVLIFTGIERAARRAGLFGYGLIALLFGLLYLCNMPILLTETTGKENALASTLLAACLNAIAGWVAETARGQRRLLGVEAGAADTRGIGAAAFGLLLGLLLITRIAPTTVLLGLVLAFAGWRRFERRWTLVGGIMLPPAAWGVYALIAYGRLLPVSGTLKASIPTDLKALGHQMALRLPDVPSYLEAVLRYAAGLQSAFIFPEPDAWIVRGISALDHINGPLRFGAVLLAATGLIHAFRWRHSTIRITIFVWLLVASILGYIAIIMLLRKPGGAYYFSWYVFDMPVLLPFVLGLAALGVQDMSWLPRVIRKIAFWLACIGAPVVAIMICLPFSAPLSFNPSPDRWSDRGIVAALYVRDTLHLGPGDMVASRNSGVLGFVLPRRVVNMDGLANDAAFKSLDANGFADDYLRRLKPKYYVDANTIRTRHVLDQFADRIKALKTFEFPQFKGYQVAEFAWPAAPD